MTVHSDGGAVVKCFTCGHQRILTHTSRQSNTVSKTYETQTLRQLLKVLIALHFHSLQPASDGRFRYITLTDHWVIYALVGYHCYRPNQWAIIGFVGLLVISCTF